MSILVWTVCNKDVSTLKVECDAEFYRTLTINTSDYPTEASGKMLCNLDNSTITTVIKLFFCKGIMRPQSYAMFILIVMRDNTAVNCVSLHSSSPAHMNTVCGDT